MVRVLVDLGARKDISSFVRTIDDRGVDAEYEDLVGLVALFAGLTSLVEWGEARNDFSMIWSHLCVNMCACWL